MYVSDVFLSIGLLQCQGQLHVHLFPVGESMKWAVFEVALMGSTEQIAMLAPCLTTAVAYGIIVSTA